MTDDNIEVLSLWLVGLGYGPEQVVARLAVEDDQGEVVLDVAVFRGYKRCKEDIVLIADCSKKSKSGLDRLRSNLKRFGVSVGVRFDGADLDVVHHLQGAFRHMSKPSGDGFGVRVKRAREFLQEGADGGRFSLRQVSRRVGIEPSYLSKIENGKAPPPNEEVIRRIAVELLISPDDLVARSGRIPKSMEQAVSLRPCVLMPLIQALKDAPDAAILGIVKKVRDGSW